MTHASVSPRDTQDIAKFRDGRGTALQTVAMMRILVEKKPNKSEVADQDSDGSSSTSGDDNGPLNLAGEDHVGSQGNDQVGIVYETAIEEIDVFREPDVDSCEIAADGIGDTKQQQPMAEAQLLQHQRSEKEQQPKEPELIMSSQRPKEEDMLVNLLSDPRSKPVALPVLRPPPGCLNRPRRVYPYESLPNDNSIRLLRVDL